MTPAIVLVILVLGALLTGCKAQLEEAKSGSTSCATREVAPRTIEVPATNTAFAAIKTEQIQVRPLRQMLKAQAGKILANENRLAHLSSRVPGRIIAVYANLGDRVKSEWPWSARGTMRRTLSCADCSTPHTTSAAPESAAPHHACSAHIRRFRGSLPPMYSR